MVENTPQSAWALQLSQALAGIGQTQYGWAQNQFNNASAVTDQQIDQYNNEANQASGMASNLLGRYENTFEPLENQYVSEAGSYASPARVQQNMGAAESATSQAEGQNAINAEQQLQSYGIDPSSGRYQELVQAQKAGAGAAEAGAGQQSMLATNATQRQMEQNAIAMGQQIPGATVNAMNAAYQGIAGAENSELGLENTGVALTDSAAPYDTAAMSLKYPGVANATTGHSGNQQHSQSQNPQQQNGGYGNGKGAGGGGGGNDGQADNSPVDNGYGTGPAQTAGAFNPNQGNAGVITNPDGFGGNTQSGTVDPSSLDGGLNNNVDGGMDPFSQEFTPQEGNAGTSAPQGGGGNYSAQNDSDPFANAQQFGSTSGNAGGYGGGGYGGGSYAAGGGVMPMRHNVPRVHRPNIGPPIRMTTGGHVPQGASPSQGQMTDDIPARLNAREFVIPQDVADWKGQEFFQKLIEQSRKARMGAPAQSSQKPALPTMGNPTFVSHKMPQGGGQIPARPQMGAQ